MADLGQTMEGRFEGSASLDRYGDEKVLRSTLSKANWTKIRPSNTVNSVISSALQFNFPLPKTGYLSGFEDSYLEFTLSATSVVNQISTVEIAGIFSRHDVIINGANMNAQSSNLPRKIGSMMSADSLQVNSTKGKMYGSPYGSTQQYADGAASGKELQGTLGALSSADPTGNFVCTNLGGAATLYSQRYSIPLRILLDSIFSMNSGIFPLAYIGQSYIQLYFNDPIVFQNTFNVVGQAGAITTQPAVTISDLFLILPIVFISREEDELVKSAMLAGDYLMMSTCTECQQVTSSSSAAVATNFSQRFSGFSPSIKEVTFQFSSTACNTINCLANYQGANAYKSFSSPRLGITRFYILIDGITVPGEAVLSGCALDGVTNQVQSYQMAMDTTKNIKRYLCIADSDTTSVSYWNHMCIIPDVSASGSIPVGGVVGYVSTSPTLSSSINVLPMFECKFNLSSVNSQLFSSESFREITLVAQTSGTPGTVGQYNAAAANISSFNIYIMCLVNRTALLGTNSCVRLL